MNSNLQLLMTGRSKQALDALEPLLHKLPGIELTTRLIVNGSVDPLAGMTAMPDILIHNLSESGEAELKALIARPASSRPTILVIGPSGDPHLMRLAMQAGVRDFFTRPVAAEELAAALRRITKEKLADEGRSGFRLTAVINAKGGSGASLMAGNLAHIMAARRGLRVALVDLDLQFGTQVLNFDLHPDQGLMEALGAVDALDTAAVEGYMTKHQSGLHLLATLPNQIVLPGEVSPKRLGQLLDILRQAYDHIVVDLPRLVDPLMNLVMERADQIVLIIQQNLANLRDARRLMHITRDELGIAAERFTVAVNRYNESEPVRDADIEETLQPRSLVHIPNDYKRVSAAMNLGAPLYEYAATAPITRALIKLADRLSGQANSEKKGLIGHLFARFS